MNARALNVIEVTSPNGLKAWLVEDHTVPVIAVEFAFRGGAALDPDGKAGLAYFTASMMDEGAGNLGSQDFQKELEDNAISLFFQADRDNVTGSLKTLTRNADKAYDLLTLALNEPRFDKDAFQRVRQQLQAEIKQMMADPSWAAYRTANKEWLAGHPYSRPVRGTLGNLSAIAPKDLDQFVKERLAKNTLAIAVAGDITAAQLGPLLDRIFGTLPMEAKSFTVPDTKFTKHGDVIVVNRALPQTRLVLMQESIRRRDPDWPALNITNYILGGGGFNSRLMLEVREKRGLTYGVSTSMNHFDHVNSLSVNAATSNDLAAETLRIIREEWQRMADGGVTEDELKDAKTFLTGALPLALTSTDRIASFLLQTQLDGLPRDYDQKRIEELNAVTVKDVARVAKKVLDEKLLNVVAVGKPEGFDNARILPDPALTD